MDIWSIFKALVTIDKLLMERKNRPVQESW